MKRLNDTLILNKAWIPVHIVTWKKAMSLIYQGHGHSLDRDFLAYNFEDWLEFTRKNGVPKNYHAVHSAKLTIAIPEIIVLTKYDKLPARDVKYSRENIFHRDKYKCQYCGEKFKTYELTVDHIFPKSRGGRSTWDNIATACKACNNHKADRTPEQAKMKLIRKPVKPQWLNPITNTRQKAHICVSWNKFMGRVDESVEEEEVVSKTENTRKTKHGKPVKDRR